MRTLLLLFALMVFTAPASRAVNTDYDPQWAPGDTWVVEFRVREIRRPKQPGPPPPAVLVATNYTYTVSAVTADRVVIEVVPDGPLRRWRLTFDRSRTVLQTVEQLLDDGAPFLHTNPFVGDAWMAELAQFHSTIIHDFPRFPDSDTNESRRVQPALSGTPAFTQTITFGADAATVVFSRTDPTDLKPHRTTVVWKQGAKWWSTAVVRLGSQVQVSGRLVP
jgi:hypothetical protein